MTQQWTKSELENWCRGWSRTPQTTLKAFIDAGFCSDQAPSREEMRLLRQPALSTVDATKPVTPAEPTRDQWTYKGWQICFDMPPIPSRAFDWVAQSPDFDAEYDDGQLVCCAGQQVHAATYEDLLQEIEDAIAYGEHA